MDAKGISNEIGRYTKREQETDIDKLKRPYIIKGIFPEREPFEKAEVGVAHDTGYNPIIKLSLEPEPRILPIKESFLDDNDAGGFTGCAYRLPKEDYQAIRRMAA